MRRTLFLILHLLLVSVPSISKAAIEIHEVAWMGNAESAANEWIELHNNGTTKVDLSGWTLVDDGTLSIALSGSLSPGAFGVLERTDDDSAPGAAFLTYTGALANDGATLLLRRADGSTADEVVGGEAWERIGGNNETKETAQLTSSGWITAPPTPGKPNATNQPKTKEENGAKDSDTEAPEESNDTKNTSVSKISRSTSNQGGSKSLTLPDVTLVLDTPKELTTYVSRPITFPIHPHGIGEALLNSLSYTWNFGAGTTSNTKEPTHRYQFPGTYVVVVEAHYARHSAQARTEVTVLPINVSLDRSDEGHVVIQSNASYELDLSKMVLSNGVETFTIPRYTMLSSGEAITLHKNRIGFTDTNTLVLINTNGSLVARFPKDVQELSPPERTTNAQHHVQKQRSERVTDEKYTHDMSDNPAQKAEANTAHITTSTEAHEPLDASRTNINEQQAAAFSGSRRVPFRYTLLALLGVIGIGILALYSVRLPS